MVIDRGFWAKRKVFLTGHTGFKGAWTSLLLARLGAQVSGFALAPDQSSWLFNIARVEHDVNHRIGDVRDRWDVADAMRAAAPEIVIHMAAQPLVRQSYAEPVETYAVNVMGTIHVLEAVRQVPGIAAVLVVTSDKCYENVGSLWGYRETDRLGGHDPYSSSKGCAELVTETYRKSFFGDRSSTRVASGRAGNVIGGGDWARDRLVPDTMRAFMAGRTLSIRNPNAVRPWQHVLDSVFAYLLLVQRAVEGGQAFAEGWNFGPTAASEVPVSHLADSLARHWGDGAHWATEDSVHPHEAGYLKLDCTKAATRLGWRPVVELDEAVGLTVEWYRAFHDRADMRATTLAQIERALNLSDRMA